MHSSRWTLSVLGAAGVALALLMLLWAASTGPGELASGGPHAQTSASSATASARPRPERVRHPAPPPAARPHRVLDLSWLGELLEVMLLLGGGWLLWRLARWLRDQQLGRDHASRIAASFEVFPDDPDVAERITADRHKHLGGLAQGSPRNGIVRCWMLFEDAARELGVGPREAETPTEFLVRLLHHLDVDPRAAARLAGLYHLARFSTHPLTEGDREAARQALVSLHADLDAAAAGRLTVDVTGVES